MRIDEVVLSELNYPGNLGVMEMAKFFQIATPEQKMHMKALIATQKTEEAWTFLQDVTKMTLQNK